MTLMLVAVVSVFIVCELPDLVLRVAASVSDMQGVAAPPSTLDGENDGAGGRRRREGQEGGYEGAWGTVGDESIDVLKYRFDFREFMIFI